ncbi:MAG: hypothetical protein IJC92_06520 [Bacteroidaceae bacterium]|nr:hypothetical protein [Bacteroidaceae bacterium]
MKKYIKPTAESYNFIPQDILMTSPGYSESGGTVDSGSELSREHKNNWDSGLWNKKW